MIMHSTLCAKSVLSHLSPDCICTIPMTHISSGTELTGLTGLLLCSARGTCVSPCGAFDGVGPLRSRASRGKGYVAMPPLSVLESLMQQELRKHFPRHH